MSCENSPLLLCGWSTRSHPGLATSKMQRTKTATKHEVAHPTGAPNLEVCVDLTSVIFVDLSCQRGHK